MDYQHKANARPVSADDIASAARGLGMERMGPKALRDLAAQHGKVDAFASAVIAKAAGAMLAKKGW